MNRTKNRAGEPRAVLSLEYERALGGVVMGIDEAGRGPLAGGVFAAAVSVPLETAADLLAGPWAGVNDSKKLSESRREELAEVIKHTEGCSWAIASASPAEIDRLNILRATHLAMRRAALTVGEKLGFPAGVCPHSSGVCPHSSGVCPHSSGVCPQMSGGRKLSILVDGLPVPTLPYTSQNLVKGDAKSLFIAAASILAKTARDADCLRLERLYPGYGFAKHKGYPTAAHLEALDRLGPCPEHRRSFGPVSQLTFSWN